MQRKWVAAITPRPDRPQEVVQQPIQLTVTQQKAQGVKVRKKNILTTCIYMLSQHLSFKTISKEGNETLMSRSSSHHTL